MTSENPVTLSAGTQLDFTYSVEWSATSTPFHRRFDRYLDYDFFEHQIHWFSIFNSFMMVIFLTGIVSLILMRTLRKDYAKYARETGDLDDLDQELDESGWKQARPPCVLWGARRGARGAGRGHTRGGRGRRARHLVRIHHRSPPHRSMATSSVRRKIWCSSARWWARAPSWPPWSS